MRSDEKYTFFEVLKNNIECAFCKEKNCRMKYYPGHAFPVGLNRYLCEKMLDKKIDKILKEP